MVKSEDKRYVNGTIMRGKFISSDDISIRNISNREMFLETSQRIVTNGIYNIEVMNKHREKKKIKGEATSSILRRTQEKNGNHVPIYEVGIKFTQLNDIEKRFLDQLIIEDTGQSARQSDLVLHEK